ncbi:hypothetical protein PO124_18195 [Bacillus licheniformis]|nr:hypothetical protein [Bacillus licheniformis]
MRQRAALARTLAVDPDILLLDEPFQPLTIRQIEPRRFSVQHVKDVSKTAVLVTHDIGEAIAMSDRILLFQSSRALSIKHLPFLNRSGS